MTIEERLSNLEFQVANINRSLIQQGRNASATTSKVDDTSNKVVAITPYTDVKTAYIGDTEVVFENVPTGNLSIFIEPNCGFTFERNLDTVNIYFVDPLDEVTNITISIQ